VSKIAIAVTAQHDSIKSMAMANGKTGREFNK